MTGNQRARRKRLGQFFSGVPLGRLLAALARAAEARTIIDPMAGCGDLLVACLLEGAAPDVLAAIEIDRRIAEECRTRMIRLNARTTVLRGDAFNRRSWPRPGRGWDLAITNPPYVRYQTGGAVAAGGVPGAGQVRTSLHDWISSASWMDKGDRETFVSYSVAYSGLADLAVPAWLLCAASITVGGRLAIVAPATWLSREYAAPVLHLLRRFFEIEYVVEDGDGSWFPDALVRPTLVVARRVHDKSSAHLPGGHLRIRLVASAADGRSLVGRTLPDADSPEAAFSAWARELRRTRSSGALGAIRASWSDEADLRRALSASRAALPGMVSASGDERQLMPERMRDVSGGPWGVSVAR